MKKRSLKEPKLSIVIALYNAEKEIEICLNSIFNSDWKDFEVIIVDDCSTDNSLKIAKKYPCSFFTTGKNSGPAAARNIGIKNAKSDILLFLDSDTKVEKDSLKKIYLTFIEQPEIWATIAMPNIFSLRKGKAPDYNALKNHYTLCSAEPYCNFFTTQMGAIRKDIFEKLGGFDEGFKSADIEDIEFGMRIPKGRIYINKEVIIGHHFPYLGAILRKYFKRAIMLTEFLKKRKELSSAHANLKGMASIIIVLISLAFLLFSLIYPVMLVFFLLSFLIFLLYNFKLFSFATQKRGSSYLLHSVSFEYLFSIAIGLGGVVGALRSPLKKVQNSVRKYVNLIKVFFLNKPIYLIFYVTSVCNSRCKMCFNWKYNTNKIKEELTLEEIDKMSRKMGYMQYVTLGGGEPYLRKDIDKICKIFYENNNAEIFSIPTNCLTPQLIKDRTEKMLNACPNAIFRVSMSIDGIGKLHDEIRGVPGNFEKVRETYQKLDELRKKYPRLEILANTTFSMYNQDKIKEIHDYIRKEFKLDMYGLTLVRGNTRDLLAKKIDLKKYEEGAKIFERSYFENKGEKRHPLQRLLTILPIFTRREVLKTAKSKRRTYSCHAIEKMIVIDSFGNVLPCEMLPDKLGNLRENNYDLNKILNKKETKELIKKIQDKDWCNCTWECAIQNSMVFDSKKYFPMIREAFFK